MKITGDRNTHLMANWTQASQLLCTPHLSGNILFPDVKVFFANPNPKSTGAAGGASNLSAEEKIKRAGGKVEDLASVTGDVLKDIMTSGGTNELERKLKNLRENDTITTGLYNDALRLAHGDFNDRVLVERLVEGKISSQQFKDIKKCLHPTSGDKEKRERSVQLAEHAARGKIDMDVFEKGAAILEIGHDGQLAALDKLLKKPDSSGQKDFNEYLKENPLNKALKDMIAAPAMDMVQDNFRRQLTTYSSVEVNELFKKKPEKPEMVEEIKKAREEFNETSAEHSKEWDGIFKVFNETVAHGDKTLNEALERAISNVLPDPIQQSEKDVTIQQFQSALKISDSWSGTNLSEIIPPELLRTLHQKVVVCQTLERKGLAAQEKAEKAFKRELEETEKLQKLKRDLVDTTRFSGMSLQPGTKIRYRKPTEVSDKERGTYTSYSWETAEIEGVFYETFGETSVEGEETKTYEVPMIHIANTDDKEFSFDDFTKWVNDTQASQVIESKEELEKEIEFSMMGKKIEKGTVLAQPHRDGKGRVTYTTYTVQEITDDGHIIMDQAVPYLAPGNTIDGNPIREPMLKQRLSYGEFARWIRRFDIVPQLKTVQEAQDAYNKEKKADKGTDKTAKNSAEKDPEQIKFEKGMFFAYGPFEQYQMLYVQNIRTDEKGQQFITINGEEFNAVELLRTAKNQHWEPLDAHAYATQATAHITNPVQRTEVYNRTAASIFRRQAVLAKSLGDTAMERSCMEKAMGLDPKGTERAIAAMKEVEEQSASAQVLSKAGGISDTSIFASAAPTSASAAAPASHATSVSATEDPLHGGGGGGGSGNGPGGHGGGPGDGGDHGGDDHGPGEHGAGKHEKNHAEGGAHGEHGEHGEDGKHHMSEEEMEQKAKTLLPKITDVIAKEDPEAEHAEIEKFLKEKEKIEKGTYIPRQGELMQLYEDTHFLSAQEMWQLAKHIWEYWERTWERKMKGRFSKFGANLPFIGTEMLRIKEETEHHEVGTYKEAISAMGVIEIRGILNTSSNADQIKACIEVLVDKGQMRWDDIRTWEAMNRIPALRNENRIPIPGNRDPYTPVGFDEKTGKKMYGMEAFGKAIDSLWGDALYQNWANKNSSAYDSGMGGFDKSAAELESDPFGLDKVAGRLKQMLKTQSEGGWVNPQEYEGYVRFIIKNGKASVEDKVYYIVTGIASRILILERLGAFANDMCNSLPFLDYFGDSSSQKMFQDKKGAYTISQITEMAKFFTKDPGVPEKNKYGPGPRVKEFLWKYALTHQKTQIRTNKAMRNADANIDHDDAHFIVPLLDEEWAGLAVGNSAGSKKYFTTAGYLNGYPGFSEWLKTLSGLSTDDNPEAPEKVVQSIKAFVRYDGLLSKRHMKDRTDLYRMSPDHMRKPSVVDGQPVIYHQVQLQDLVRRIGKEFGIETTTNLLFQETPNYDTDKAQGEKQKSIDNAFKNYGRVLEEAIAKDPHGREKLMKIVRETGLMGYDYEVDEKKRAAAKARAEQMKKAAADAEGK